MTDKFRRGWHLLALAWLLSGAGCGQLPDLMRGMAAMPKQFEPHLIIVTLSEDKRAQWTEIDHDIRARYALQRAGEFPLTSIHVNCLVYRAPETMALDDVIRQLRADKRIEWAQDNQVFAGLQTAESDGYSLLSYGPKMIRANAAHRIATGKGVPVTIIDTGADKNHPDLKGRVSDTRNFVDGGELFFSEDRHGTAVAGIIGARANDGIGIDGIAPEADIAIFKACWYDNGDDDKALCSSWTLAKALDAAIMSGSRVINLSLNGPDDGLLKQLLEAAERRHIILIAAGKERGTEPGFPASLDFVIPVVSSGPHGDTAQPDWAQERDTLAAPGVEVLTTTPEGYDFLSGSSLAAAHVSGVAALLLQYHAGLEPEQVRKVLKRTGQAASSGRSSILIDACRALADLGALLECQ